MAELITIREAARRLGVSDTAVHKAIKSGRVTVGPVNPNNGRPQLEWPAARDQWLANSDTSKRSHVGPRGGHKTGDEPEVRLPTSDRMDEAPQIAVGRRAAGTGPKSGRDANYAESRADREHYQAELARLDFEERSGLLVSVDQLKADAFKAHRMVRDAILNIPDRCAPHLASLQEPAEVHAYLLEEINEALRKLAADIYAPSEQP